MIIPCRGTIVKKAVGGDGGFLYEVNKGTDENCPLNACSNLKDET
jgi:hypothetical protein